MITSIFFDIDGTLVSFKTHKVPEDTVKALQEVRRKGIRIFVATGRGYNDLRVLEGIPFDGYITLNGQYSFDGNGQTVCKNFLTPASVRILLEELKTHPFPCGFTTEEGKVFNFRDARVDGVHEITHNDNQPAGDISHMAEKKVFQCMAFLDRDEEAALMKKLPDCISARWHPDFTDISPAGGTKSLGIDRMLSHFGLDPADSLSFGDGGNDIPMLLHTGRSVAMGIAGEDVKDCADLVTESAEEGGIRHALAAFGLVEDDPDRRKEERFLWTAGRSDGENAVREKYFVSKEDRDLFVGRNPEWKKRGKRRAISCMRRRENITCRTVSTEEGPEGDSS